MREWPLRWRIVFPIAVVSDFSLEILKCSNPKTKATTSFFQYHSVLFAAIVHDHGMLQTYVAASYGYRFKIKYPVPIIYIGRLELFLYDLVQIIQHNSRSLNHTVHRILCDEHRDPKLFRQQLVQSMKKCTAAR